MKALRWIIIFMAFQTVALAQQGRGNLTASGTSAGCNAERSSSAIVFTLPDDKAGAAIQVDPTFSGTVSFYGSSNSGVWGLIAGTPQAGGAQVSSTTAAGTWQFGPAGIQGLCAVMTSYSSGSAGITISATGGAPPTGGGSTSLVAGTACPVGTPCYVQGVVADGAATSGNPVPVGGVDGSGNRQVWLCDTSGICNVNLYVGGVAVTAVTDPCDGQAKTIVPFSISSATTTQIFAASASNKYYICYITIVVASANNVALVEDNDASCISPTAGMDGGTTAATGYNLTANGLQKGNGSGTVAVTAAVNRYVCLITSGTAQTSGSIGAVAAP